ncbi:MAG TPA: asparaginase [Thermoanaerobaculia bacterium]|nr:asparaginase [Thermoanaerobaculia bacterium]
MERLISVWRGDYLESSHYGSVAVVDSLGRLLAWAGDPAHRTFLRSAAKPIQAIPLALEGGIEEYELSSEELALVCASHGGEPKHVATAAALLRKGELDETDLLCGAHAPLDERAAAELRQSGDPPTPLHNNCSGKHAGMLLACRLLELPTADYVDPEHPLQKQTLQILAEFAGIDPDEIGLAVDGCGVPAYHLPLYRTALAYARFAGSARPNGSEPSLPRYADAARDLFDAMTSHPDYVAGAWSMTTPLMEAFDGRLLAKEGAEGFYAMALEPSLAAPVLERLGFDEPLALGIALKIADGSMARGRDPAVLRTLEQLGIPIDTAPLAAYRDLRITNTAGRQVGRIRSEFELTFP